MRTAISSRLRRCMPLLVGAALLLLPLSGCAVDTNELAVDVLRAALDSVSNSLVDTLSQYLAGK